MSTLNDVELRRIVRLLKKIAEMAEQTSLTGALSGGAIDALERYNLILTNLENKGIDLGGMFPPLPANASFDRVGVAANLLAAYLKEEEEERSLGAPNIVIGNLGSVSDLEKLKDLGKMIEENFPEWMRRKPAETGNTPTDKTEADTVKVEEQSIPMPDFTRSNA
jgi:hypothetical protein